MDRPLHMDAEHLLSTAKVLRAYAEPCGPLHAYWDLILDMEACAFGRPMLLEQSSDTLLAEADRLLRLRLGRPLSLSPSACVAHG